ncbi:MBOAT family protein, partial [Klebsiella oxytoca]
TFFLVCIGDLLFRAASVGDALAMLRGAVRVWNPQVLWDGSLLQLGLDGIETAVTVLSLLLLWAVSLKQR